MYSVQYEGEGLGVVWKELLGSSVVYFLFLFVRPRGEGISVSSRVAIRSDHTKLIVLITRSRNDRKSI
jgi:hypothetical protein